MARADRTIDHNLRKSDLSQITENEKRIAVIETQLRRMMNDPALEHAILEKTRQTLRSDLEQAQHYVSNIQDRTLREGYRDKASDISKQIKAIETEQASLKRSV